MVVGRWIDIFSILYHMAGDIECQLVGSTIGCLAMHLRSKLDCDFTFKDVDDVLFGS
jgi:hypothetical protein